MLYVTDGRGYKRQFTYNSNDQVTKIQVYTGGTTLVTTFDYGYDSNGNQSSRTETKGAQVNTTTYTYDNLNRRLTEGFPGSRSNTYTYDKNGNIATLVDGSGTVTYGYDDINRVASITDPASATPISYAYDDNPSSGSARKRERTFPGGLKDQTLYDTSGKLTSLKLLNGSTVLRSLALTYGTSPGSTPTDLLSTATEQSGDVRHYTYDIDDQLTRFWITSGASTTYDWNVGISGGGKYDAGGNRLGLIPNSGSAVRYQTNNAHQLCYQTTGATTPACSVPPAGATVFNYGLNGNQTTNTGAGAAAYDELDRVQTLGGSTSLGYLTPTNGELTSVGATVLQNNLMGLGRNGTTAYTRDPDDGSVVDQRGSSSTEYLFADQIGSTTDLFTGTSVVRTYGYDPDGNARGGSGSGAQTDIRYAGGHLVNGLYHYGLRYYDPGTARWTQPDPFSQIGDLGQANRYAYAGGDSINNVDSSGALFGIPGKDKILKAAARLAARYPTLTRLAGAFGLACAQAIYAVIQKQSLGNIIQATATCGVTLLK